MKAEVKDITGEGWVCANCKEKLVKQQVRITYLNSAFEVDLPCCPKCGFTFIPPELAEGKMLEAERILEDK